jgi:hypothetical protein
MLLPLGFKGLKNNIYLLPRTLIWLTVLSSSGLFLNSSVLMMEAEWVSETLVYN